jgi:mRNA interferase RelE/StbE
MAYEVFYSDEAVERLKNLRAFDRAAILDEIESVLLVNPTQESKARVKFLRQPAPTQYRLRVGEFRVFYDVLDQSVQVIQILSKADCISYLEGSS